LEQEAVYVTPSQARRALTSRAILADAALLLVTLVWGATFVMVKDAVSNYPVFSFLAIRFWLATIALLPVLWIRRSRRPAKVVQAAGLAIERRALLMGSLLVGAALFAGYSFQTFGLRLTTPAKAGFITGLSVVIVPVVAALVSRRSPGRNVWIGVALATTGLALLSLNATLTIEVGDLVVMGCAFSFAAHILLTSHFARRCDPLRLAFGQILVVAVLSTLAAGLPEGIPPPTQDVLFAAAFTGLLATSAAFGIQTVAQRYTTASHTALIFAAEPVFAGLFSFLLIGEVLTARQMLGAFLILAGMIVAEFRREAPVA
jgi:drug/metabolite transporter (DMT)-like permease